MISICYIARSVGGKIIKSLNSLEGLDCEVCIAVDTRTTDNTKEVVTEWFIENKIDNWICDHDWSKHNNSFAEARNRSAQLALGEWILMLDADETLSEKTKENINKLITSKDIDIWGFVQLDENGQMCQTFRLYRNGLGIEFIGDIHEVVNIEGRRYHYTDITIDHNRNLTPEEHQKKVMWILDTIAGVSDEVKKDYYEGIYYLHTGNHKKGLDALNRCIDKVSHNLKAFIYSVASKHYINISRMYDVEGFYFLTKSLELAPKQNTGYMQLAEYYFKINDFERALENLYILQDRENRFDTELQNDKYYSDEEIQSKIKQIEEVRYGIIN